MLQKHVYSQWLTAIAALLMAGSSLAQVPKSSAAEAKAMREEIKLVGAVGHVFKDCPDCADMVVIPSGTFTMGSSAAEQALANAAKVPTEWTNWESPQHSVRVRSFAMGRYAVTKAEFAAFVQDKGYQTDAERGDGCTIVKDHKGVTDKAYNWRNVGFSQTDNHPVVCVSWNDAQAYVQWLGERTGKPYRLPSESEREYATRAGSQTAFWWGDSITTDQANYIGFLSYNGSPKGAFRQATVPVNSFSANPFGLYNVHGNVYEWVQDCFHDNYNGAPVDGSAWTTACSNNVRVLRGGCWSNGPAILRSAIRGRGTPDSRFIYDGFRLVRTLLTP